MLKAFQTRCALGGLLLALCALGVPGLIEIVEEQRCHDYEFRLTCRELDTHIAILDAWYISAEDYHRISNDTPTHASMISTENDSELDRVYVYSSPKHNGVYELTNHSIFENSDNSTNNVNVTLTSNLTDFNVNDTLNFNDTFDSVDISVDFVNASEGCGVETFARSYASWHEGEKRKKPVSKASAMNLRAPLSYRCTGVNHCSFVLAEDYLPSMSWSPGVVYIKYACFDDLVSIHYCNREVSISAQGPESEGYIRTPGYPHFYVEDECRWRLRVHPEQRIRVTLLDVDLRSIGPFEDSCTDFVSVEDSNGSVLLSTCQQVFWPLQLTSTVDSVEIVVKANSKGAFPKRGVLLHYKSVGCVTLSAPSDGYLVYRNENVAHFMCNVNFVFEDTRQRARVIWCYDDNRWNETLPSCIEEAASKVAGDTKLPHNEANMIVDIVIPSLLIAALFIGNAFIVLIIYKYRKRKTDDLEDEFNTIPLSSNGVHSAGNAV
ncbi:uncharacterized protein LOC123879710 isoform X1 [Maniola jurtina]|uniref:uncharacterized protein LOC123879710 isoform X1 n=1 Tax=Maniola jurtina TaxID=191418 RepID=UPI001E689537|nr:uncharacterized protein LOC123879710 isoform X1 [Maniola jurtina]